MCEEKAMRLAWAMLLLTIHLPKQVLAQPANSTTLCCNGTSKPRGTATADLKPEPITGLSIIIDLSQGTVAFDAYVVPIKSVTASSVEFTGRQMETLRGGLPKPFVIIGSIDWVTGATSIEWLHADIGKNARWELMCRAVTPML
jgi:hypothetical protein